MIRITNAKEGFRRGGIAHPKGTAEYPDDTFTKEQIDQLRKEPRLAVDWIPDKAGAGKKKDEGKE